MAIFDNAGNLLHAESELYDISSPNTSLELEYQENAVFGFWGHSHDGLTGGANNALEVPALWEVDLIDGRASNGSFSLKGIYCGTNAEGVDNICDVTYTYSYSGVNTSDNLSTATIVNSSAYGRTQFVDTGRFSSSFPQPSKFKLVPTYAKYNDDIQLVVYLWFVVQPNGYISNRRYGLAAVNVPTSLYNRAFPITRESWHDTTWELKNYQFSERDLDSTTDTSQGGGYGTGSMPADNIDIPALPAINMSDTGATLYSLTALQMKNFRSWLWSTDWVDNLKKIRTDPMQNIIGISIVDVPISTGLNALIYVGNVASTVEANVITNSFIELDCGEITLDEFYGSFADYEPFIATTLYLPKVGFVQIPADVCVNNTIKVVYHIELSSGEGLCYVQLTSKRDGFTYIYNTYTCHVTSNITLSAQDHSQQLVALGNAIINTGISASNAIVNPASATQGLTNTLSSCIDVATTKNPTSTKGNVGNMSAVMCYKKPYLLINRTNLTKPSSFQENNGYLINYTSTIGGHTGFLQTRNYHCSFNAPYNHRAEIERLMDGGVIINA